MKEAREVIAEELERLEGPCDTLALQEADIILSALDAAGYVVIHKDNGEAFEQWWLNYLKG